MSRLFLGQTAAGPPGAPDRQVTGAAATIWPGAADLNDRLAAGKVSDAAGILRHAALASDPAETAAALGACYSEGLGDAANMVIAYATQRSERDIMRIAAILIDGGHYTGAGELLSLAIAR